MIKVPSVTVEQARDVLRSIPPPFLLHKYEAAPEDYDEITDEDLKCEFMDGELTVHSPASIEHEDLAGFMLALLREFVTDRKLGRAYGSNAVMQLSGQRIFSPDVSVLINDHLDRIQNGRVHGAMDLAVEVISPSTRDYDRGQKLPAYQDGRVPEIWIVDAEKTRFETFVLRDDEYEKAQHPANRYESAVLRGLSIDVTWFWKDPRPSIRDCLNY